MRSRSIMASASRSSMMRQGQPQAFTAAPRRSRRHPPGRTGWRVLPTSAAGAAGADTTQPALDQTPPAAGHTSYDPPHFAALPLDRSAPLRKDDAQLARLLASPSSRVLLLHSHKLLVAPPPPDADDGQGLPFTAESSLQLVPHCFGPGQDAPDGSQPDWVPVTASAPQLQASVPAGLQGQLEFLFLGMDRHGAAVFAAHTPQHLLHLLPPLPAKPGAGSGTAGQQQSGSAGDTAPPADAEPVAPAGHTAAAAGPASVAPIGAAWADVRRAGQRMTGPDAAVAALAVGLSQWHSSAAFCSRTGAKTLPTAGGHSRTPVAAPPGSSSASRRPRSVYPRLDPAVIVAVGCGDWLLLGRKASWEAGRYSCLAGFAEVAETLEQAVEREVWEEAGVGVDLSTARYHSSQPWPFPQSIMIGFTVEAAAPTATVVPLAAETPAGAAAAAGAAAGAARAPTPQPQQQQLPAKRGLALLSGPAAMAAREVGLLPAEAERYLLPRLPAVQVDPRELEDARWFHAHWLAAAVQGRTPLDVVRGGAPDASACFCIPGRYALANHLISSWLQGRRAVAGAGAEQSGQSSTSRSGSSSGTGCDGGSGQLGAAAAAAEEEEAAEQLLAAVPDVSIDEGSFKYVLLRLSTADGRFSKLLVRGDSRAAYHNHIFQATAAAVREAAPGAGLVLDTVGGGRIEHYSQQRALSVFGFSAAFGQAPHEVTAALLRRWLPLHDIVVSYSGY